MKKLQNILTILLAVVLLTGCAVSAATLPTQSHVTQRSPDRLLPEDAAAIALEDAGVTAEQAVRLRTEYEVDDRIPEYEVEFRSGDYEYDYTIHAETGAILRRGKEYDPPATQPPINVTAATEPAKAPAAPVQTTGKITAEQAESIALAHVELARADVTGLRTEYDIDDGVPEYEVEFRSGRLEYDFEIHAETGAILDFDWDD